MVSTDVLRIDGSWGEGGGQIVRNALALSIVTGRKIEIINIRAGRRTPGLKPQHLSALKGAALISSAEYSGGKIGSKRIVFSPHEPVSGEYHLDIGTAGSITLLLQCLLPPLVQAKGKTILRLTGGTDVSFSPPVDWMKEVLFPLLRLIGIRVEMEVLRRGFYPRGGGEVIVSISGGPSLKPLRLYRTIPGKLKIMGRAFVTNLPTHIAERMAESAEKTLLRELEESDKVTEYSILKFREEGIGKGTGITLRAEGNNGFYYGPGASALGRKGVPSEVVGKTAAFNLIPEIKGKFPLDVHAADQLPVFVPLIHATAGSRLYYPVREMTPHLKTVLWLLRLFGYPSENRIKDGIITIIFP